ncbi:MAG: hypothetical protein IAA31_02230 [Candidatus Anaerobiospirillum merdipullorum]|uniref:Uncharacterized protein n=1 Tax=Candidatus Anaerobiospirillum merdipullorum TaxID=2838450 RepID=A0A9E2NRL0_9GAMM|nr:hypothetical protein [Candidatus Anaerobiospirillum merdipullorum]
MLKEFMRNYAKNMGFAPDDADYIADEDVDQGLFTLSLNDVSLCTIAPYEKDGQNFALAVVGCGGADEESELVVKAKALSADFARYGNRKCDLIATMAEDKVLGFLARLSLDDCTQADFDDFMASLIYFVTVREDESFVPKYAEISTDLKPIDDFLREAGIDPDTLSNALDCIRLPDGPVVMVVKKPQQQELIFRTMVKSGASDKAIVDCLSANMSLLGRHFFSVDSSNNIFFQTPLQIKNKPEVFYDLLSTHAGMSVDFAEALEKDEQAPKDEASLESNLSQFLMV